MEIVGYAIYGIGVVLAGSFLFGIRSYTANGTGVSKQTVNTTMLFIVSLVVVPAMSLSPLHLLWMFPVSFMLGMLSLIFPFSLLSIPGRVIFYIACFGLDLEEAKARSQLLKKEHQERMSKMQSLMNDEGLTADQAKDKLERHGEW